MTAATSLQPSTLYRNQVAMPPVDAAKSKKEDKPTGSKKEAKPTETKVNDKTNNEDSKNQSTEVERGSSTVSMSNVVTSDSATGTL